MILLTCLDALAVIRIQARREREEVVDDVRAECNTRLWVFRDAGVLERGAQLSESVPELGSMGD